MGKLQKRLPGSRQAMLDYSDEEGEPRSVRKRNPSPPRPGPRGTRQGPEGKGDELPLDFSLKTQSIFKTFRDRSSRLIMPTSNRPAADAFIVSEFIPGKATKAKPEVNDFGLSLKGCGATQEPPEIFPLDSADHPDSFYKSMTTLVLLAQFFGVFPVSGTRGHNYRSLTFKWIHYKTAYWSLAFLGTVFCFVANAVNGLEEGAFQAASGILYFACGVLSSLLMLSLSRNWRKLNREFAQVEVRFKKYGYPRNIGFRFRVFTIVFLLVGLAEHVFSKLKSFKMVAACSQWSSEFSVLAKSFFLSEYSEVFSLLSYSLWKGALVFIAHFLVTANWNFKDLFLCLISWTISERFRQVHDLLERVHGQDKPVSFWKEAREDFNTLSVLTKRVDSYIRKLMFLSIGNNLFFICIQLFHSLKKKLDLFQLLYFFWSFGFLVLRTGFVAFSAARINDESKEPKTILYSVPQKNYTAEVRRFLTQLTTHEVALTGSGFFSVTRSLILTITGSVITYEIVLVQFGDKEVKDAIQVNRSTCFFK